MARVAGYILASSGHAKLTVPAMLAGAAALGDETTTYYDVHFAEKHLDLHDTAVFWGYVATCQRIMEGYRSRGKSAVYLDLGYWSRAEQYKVAVNSRHPTVYFQNYAHDDTRRLAAKIEPLAWCNAKEGYVLVAGMGPKSAWAEKLEPVESWETQTISRLKQLTARELVYRPKPSQGYGRSIKGARLDSLTPLNKALHSSWAVVTHHSNVAVDALIAGVPVFATSGVAAALSGQLEAIESPYYPSLAERTRWLNDVSYTQWSVAEMKSGAVWQHFKKEGLVK